VRRVPTSLKDSPSRRGETTPRKERAAGRKAVIASEKGKGANQKKKKTGHMSRGRKAELESGAKITLER